jgi:predicted Zn-dependent peptidase
MSLHGPQDQSVVPRPSIARRRPGCASPADPICIDAHYERESATMDEPIQLTRLPSGLTVVTERMDRVETVSIGAYVASGSRNESKEENGVSHFLEHMAFKGTTTRSAAAIAEEVEAVGGHINAYTAREQTAYYVKMLKEDTALGFDIIGDILTRSVFEPEELERERGVILQEIGQANDTPDDIIFDHFQSTAYPDQALGRAVLGSEEVIRGMPRSLLTDYMRRNYTNSNVVVAAAGHLQHQNILDLVQKHFADLPGSVPPRFSDATYTGGEFRQERDLDQVRVVLGFPSVGYGDTDYYPTMLLSTLLGGGMSSRLFQEIREKRGLVYSIYSFAAPFQDGGLFGIYAGTGESEAAELMPVMLAELGKVQTSITEAELSRARAQLKASLLMSQESTGSRCEQLARQIQTFGRVIPTAEVLAKINAVTQADICRAAARHFRASPTLATVGPSAQVPSLNNIVEALAA